MISTLKKLLEAIEASRVAPDFTVNETPGLLQIAGSMSRSALSAWQSVFDDKCSWLSLEVTVRRRQVLICADFCLG